MKRARQIDPQPNADFHKLAGPPRSEGHLPRSSLSLNEAISVVEARLPKLDPLLRDAFHTLVENAQRSNKPRQVAHGTGCAGEILARELSKLMGDELSLRALEERCGVTFSGLSKILHQTRSPDVRTLCRIAAAFGKSPRGLLFPEIAGHEPPLKAHDAQVKVAATLRALFPEGCQRYQLHGILELSRSPRLATLEKLAIEAGVPLVDLLP